MRPLVAEEFSECLPAWSRLGNRPEGLQPGYADLADLLFALDSGWEIDPPVYAHQDTGWRPYYHILLKREGRYVLLSLPDTEALRVFLREQSIRVEMRSTVSPARRGKRDSG
ncbi:MAG: hypothetical protein J7452_02805 [Thermoflexus sp.]|nr:hypothetical protein [Thermoflexus sp.]